MKKSLIIFCLLLIGSTLVLDTLSPFVGRVHAEQTGEWIDKVSIKLGDAFYKDADPFDNRDEYVGAESSPGCSNHLWIDDMSGTGKKAHVDIKHTNSNGECVDGKSATDTTKTESVTLSNEGARWVTAYQVDADTIFMPAYLNFDNMNDADILKEDHRHSYNGTFKRLPVDNSYCTANNLVSSDDGPDKDKCAAFARSTNGVLDAVKEDPGNYTVWVKTRDGNAQKFATCVRVLLDSCRTKIDGVDITFANNRKFTAPPTAAGYPFNEDGTPKQGEDTTEEGSAGDPCQDNNPLDFAWWACGMLGAIDSGLEGVTSALSSLLSVSAEDFSAGDKGEKLRTVWSYFRALASFLVIGVALVMIIGQAVSGD